MKRIAVITGASSGMGREFALQICKRFASIDEIWLIARREAKLRELAEDISFYCEDMKVNIISGDLCCKDTIDRYKELLRENCIKIKLLVNCAGYGKLGAFYEGSEDEQYGMIDLNIKALVHITKLSLPYMAYDGRIINLASAAAFLPQPQFAVYAATKSFVLSFSRALNRELRKEHIYITAVCPGPVDTEFFNIAQEHGTKAWYKDYVMAACEKVVTKALDAAMLKKSVTVYGVPMKAFRALCKVIPHSFILHFL